METNRTYNGWSNYQTWAMHLYLGDYFTERTTEYIEQGGVVSVHDVADVLRSDFGEFIYNRFPDNDKREGIDNLIADLFSSATDAVDWCELAEAYLDNIGVEY